MCACVCVCAHKYLCVCLTQPVCIHKCVYVCVRVCVCMPECVCVYMRHECVYTTVYTGRWEALCDMACKKGYTNTFGFDLSVCVYSMCVCVSRRVSLHSDNPTLSKFDRK